MLTQEQFNKLIFTTNLDRDGNTTMFFIIEEAKERNCFGLFTKNCKGFVNTISLNAIFIEYKVQFNFYQYKMTQ